MSIQDENIKNMTVIQKYDFLIKIIKDLDPNSKIMQPYGIGDLELIEFWKGMYERDNHTAEEQRFKILNNFYHKLREIYIKKFGKDISFTKF